MTVSSSTNHYIQPVKPEQPNSPQTQHAPEDVYKASNGNAISDKDGNLSLTPEGQLNVANKEQASADAQAADDQASKDATRENAVDYVAYQSKKSQVEIYLSVATDSKVDLDDGTATLIESLRETQKQNNTVQAYAQYQESQ